MYRPPFNDDVFVMVCSIAVLVLLTPCGAGGEEEPIPSVSTDAKLSPEKEPPPGREHGRRTPRGRSWRGLYWPNVGVEHPGVPSTMEGQYDLEYSSLYEYVILPSESVPKEDRQFGSRFSWLRENAYERLAKLQQGELAERYILDSPWKKWKDAFFKDPKAIQKVVSVRHSRVFGERFDGLYDYPLDAVNGWRMRFILHTRTKGLTALNPRKIEFLRSRGVTRPELLAIGERLRSAQQLREVGELAEMFGELPLVDFKAGRWRLVESRFHRNPDWMEVTFSGPLTGRSNNRLEFVLATDGIFIRLEGTGISRIGTPQAPALDEPERDPFEDPSLRPAPAPPPGPPRLPPFPCEDDTGPLAAIESDTGNEDHLASSTAPMITSETVPSSTLPNEDRQTESEHEENSEVYESVTIPSDPSHNVLRPTVIVLAVMVFACVLGTVAVWCSRGAIRTK